MEGKTAYAIIVSKPGYMPEHKPYYVVGSEAALDALHGELEVTATCLNPDEDPPAVDSVPAAVEYAGYVHEAIPVGLSVPGKALRLDRDVYAVGEHIVHVERGLDDSGGYWVVRPVDESGNIVWKQAVTMKVYSQNTAAVIGAKKLFSEN